MEKITSFTINHLLLQPGVYVSRKDPVGGTTVTTFDLRLTSPNEEPVMNTAEVHAIEHLGATFLRNHPVWSSKVLYFGPMGCRTGFYLLLSGDYESKDILSLMIEMWEFIRDYEGEIPGASPRDCGNYLDMNLPMAKYLAKKYLEEVLYQITEDRLVYPCTRSQKTGWYIQNRNARKKPLNSRYQILCRTAAFVAILKTSSDLPNIQASAHSKP